MKTIFMCVNYPIYNESIGISKKIRTQIETFEKMGFEVTYSAYLENGVAIICKGEVLKKRIYKNSKFNSILRRFRLLDLCSDYLGNMQYDLGFVRWDAADYQFLSVLKKIDRCCKKVLMDFHGYFPGYNIPGLKGKFTKYFTKLNGHKYSKYVDLGLTETKNLSLFGLRTMPIDTGIDVSKYQTHCYMGDKSHINMISVANETVYHGYDRIIKGLHAYINETNDSSLHLHLVGKMSDKTLQLIKDLNLDKYVTVYGYQSGNKLIEIYNQCNLGVGPLAPHRTGGKEGTGIKTKEYFAIGLPYFYAGQELLVPDNFPYVLKMKAEDTPIDIEQIILFWDKIKFDCNKEKIMREFAEDNYSWEKMFRNALDLLDMK